MMNERIDRLGQSPSPTIPEVRRLIFKTRGTIIPTMTYSCVVVKVPRHLTERRHLTESEIRYLVEILTLKLTLTQTLTLKLTLALTLNLILTPILVI